MEQEKTSFVNLVALGFKRKNEVNKMIKVENGQVELKGNPVNICTDLTLAIRGVVTAFEENEIPKEEAIDLVNKAIELALKGEDELRKEAEAKIGKLLMRMFDEILKDEEQGE